MRVVLRRQGKVVADLPYSTILVGGDVALQKGDEIVISPESQVVTIIGAVAKSGNLPIAKDNLRAPPRNAKITPEPFTFFRAGRKNSWQAASKPK